MVYLNGFLLIFALAKPALATDQCWKQLTRDRHGQRLVLNLNLDLQSHYQLPRGTPLFLNLDKYALMRFAFAFSGSNERIEREGFARYFIAETYVDPRSNQFRDWRTKEKFPQKGSEVQKALRGLDGLFLYGSDRGTAVLFDSVQHATEHEVSFGGRITIPVRNLVEFVAIPRHIQTRDAIIYTD